MPRYQCPQGKVKNTDINFIKKELEAEKNEAVNLSKSFKIKLHIIKNSNVNYTVECIKDIIRNED